MVVLASGHLVDRLDRPNPRFPADLEPVVATRIRELFADWSIGADDLVLCGGARGADILFAECALDRGAQVWLLLALPPEPFVERSVALSGHRWERRFYELLPRCRVDVLPDALRKTGKSPFELVNHWMVEEALRLSPPARLVAALVWDELPGGGPGGTGSMAGLLRQMRIPTVVVNPRALA